MNAAPPQRIMRSQERTGRVGWMAARQIAHPSVDERRFKAPGAG
jgi:hypothetical protein